MIFKRIQKKNKILPTPVDPNGNQIHVSTTVRNLGTKFRVFLSESVSLSLVKSTIWKSKVGADLRFLSRLRSVLSFTQV